MLGFWTDCKGRSSGNFQWVGRGLWGKERSASRTSGPRNRKEEVYSKPFTDKRRATCVGERWRILESGRLNLLLALLLKEEKGDDRGRDGWMTSLTQWTWVWASSRRWWRTGKPGVLQSMGSQSQTRLSDWTELLLKEYSQSLCRGSVLSSVKWASRYLSCRDVMMIQRDEAWRLAQSKIGAISSMTLFLAFLLV